MSRILDEEAAKLAPRSKPVPAKPVTRPAPPPPAASIPSSSAPLFSGLIAAGSICMIAGILALVVGVIAVILGVSESDPLGIIAGASGIFSGAFIVSWAMLLEAIRLYIRRKW